MGTALVVCFGRGNLDRTISNILVYSSLTSLRGLSVCVFRGCRGRDAMPWLMFVQRRDSQEAEVGMVLEVWQEKHASVQDGSQLSTLVVGRRYSERAFGDGVGKGGVVNGKDWWGALFASVVSEVFGDRGDR